MAVAMEGVEEGTDSMSEAKKLLSPKKSRKRKGGGKEKRAVDIDQVNAPKLEGINWDVKTVSGADLVSKQIAISQDSRHIIAASGDQVLVYAAASGHLVRKLNTGHVMAVKAGNSEGTVYTASSEEICLWSYSTVEVLKRLPILLKAETWRLNGLFLFGIFFSYCFFFLCLICVQAIIGH